MNPFRRVISAGLSPNTETDDYLRALHIMVRPHLWTRGDWGDSVVRWFREQYRSSFVCTFDSGRSALYALLLAFGIRRGYEVIVQAFTCVAVPNSVLWVGATPIYADIDETLNMDPKDLARKITPKTKAVIVQHTFGYCADMDAIMDIARRKGILVIEDCAHSLGSMYHGKKAGTFGAAAFFSFGRDKVLSSVWGGAAMINPSSPIPGGAERLRKFHASVEYPGMFWIFQQLMHPIAFSVILPFYAAGSGKLLLVMLQKIGILSFPVYEEEKRGKKPERFPSKYPNALAGLLLVQLRKLSRFTQTRKKTSSIYRQHFEDGTKVRIFPQGSGDIPLRFPISVENPELLLQKARKRGILLGNWYHNVIDPSGVRFATVRYRDGSCPNAERIAAHMVNLPTRIPDTDVRQILRLFPKSSG